MIKRYSRPEMQSIWDDAAKYAAWADVERAHLTTLVEQGQAPASVLEDFNRALQSKNKEHFLAREQETGHDVIAFVAEVGDAMGQSGSFLHKGLTSSDVVDTSQALRIQSSLCLLIQNLASVRIHFTQKSFEHSSTLCIGRTHGIHAEPMSFGQVLASHFAEFQRAHMQLLGAQKALSYGKLSGAVGTYSQLSPQFEERVLERLGLQVEPVATQVIPRDRIVALANAVLACSQAVERFATSVRHWARTELGEVLEPFSSKQKGSSAMPHKKNPILAENLCGLARTVRGFTHMLTESAALWHERDISHSSVERVALADMFIVTDFMLARTKNLVEKMVVRAEAMHANVWKTGGLWASQSVLTALVSKGMNRTEAYELVQRIALPISEKVALGKVEEKEFLKKLNADSQVTKVLNKEELADVFSEARYLTSVEPTFKRVFGMVPTEYAKQIKKHPATECVPALQTVVKVSVSLLPDVLDTEAKTIANDMRTTGSRVLELRQQKQFLVRVSCGSSFDLIQTYAHDVLHNPVMEHYQIEVVQ